MLLQQVLVRMLRVGRFPSIPEGTTSRVELKIVEDSEDVRLIRIEVIAFLRNGRRVVHLLGDEAASYDIA